MKAFTLGLALVIGLFAGTRADAGISLSFSSVLDANLNFHGTGSGAELTFNNDNPSLTGHGFAVTLIKNGPSAGVPLFGTISGTFVYTSVQSTPGDPLQTAILTGVGLLTIGPDGGPKLTANIEGVIIKTSGSEGGINTISSIVNLSSVAYNPAPGDNNVTLAAYRDQALAGGGIAVISFTFDAPGKSLEELSAINVNSPTSYSGTLSTVPEPGSMAMALTGVAMLGLGCYRQRRHKLA